MKIIVDTILTYKELDVVLNVANAVAGGFDSLRNDGTKYQPKLLVLGECLTPGAGKFTIGDVEFNCGENEITIRMESESLSSMVAVAHIAVETGVVKRTFEIIKMIEDTSDMVKSEDFKVKAKSCYFEIMTELNAMSA